MGMSQTMSHYVAGLLNMPRTPPIFWPLTSTSYKRFAAGTFAPTKAVTWSIDNRTSAFRLCGDGTKAIRIECRVGGSDLNPYLALAAQLACGIAGLEEKLALAPANPR